MTGYTYFIRKEDEDKFKIGKTVREPYKRLKELQTASAERLLLYGIVQTEDPSELEWQLHDKYRDCHLMGDWFALSQEIVDKEVRSLGGKIHQADWLKLEHLDLVFYFCYSRNRLYITLKSLEALCNTGLELRHEISSLSQSDFEMLGNEVLIAYFAFVHVYPTETRKQFNALCRLKKFLVWTAREKQYA